jgi:hypothetical protein
MLLLSAPETSSNGDGVGKGKARLPARTSRPMLV